MNMDAIYKTYIYKNLAQELGQFVKKNMKNLKDIDFDKEALLNRAGLTTYSPVKSSLGGLSLLVLGGLAGAAIALALAPKRGSELRTDVKDKALKLMERANAAIGSGTDATADVRA